MSSNRSADDPRDASPSFACDWHPEAFDAASVRVSGELDIETSPRLEQILDRALRHGRLVLLNLHEVAFMDVGAFHVMVNASDRARENGGRLLVVGAPPHAQILLELTGAGGSLELLPIELSPRVDRVDPDHDRMPHAATPGGPRSEGSREDVKRQIRPLDNPANSRVLAGRVMAVDDRGLWLHGSDGVLRRAWAPQAAGLSVPPGTPVELYLDDRGEVNGWRDPRSGVAINQRRLDRAMAPATDTALVCQGACGVVWRAPAAAQLTEHDERCLTCAGPLARD